MANRAKRQINFTKANIDSLPLPPRNKRFCFYDSKGNGLHIVVTSMGQKSFYIRRYLNGRGEKHCLGPYPDLSIEQARDKAARFVGAIASGDNPAEKQRLLREELTLRQMFDEYLNRHLKKSRKTWPEYQKQFNMYFAHCLNYKLSSLTQHDVERMHGELGRTRGPYAANRGVELLRAMYNKAIAWHLYQGLNPAIGITPFEERPRERVLEADEFEKFFTQLEKEEQWFRDFVMITLLTGARKTNVLSMSWDNINLKTGNWTIPGTKSKNNRTQIIPLTQVELDILHRRHHENQQRPFPSPFVFPGEGDTGHLIDVKRAWMGFCFRAYLDNLHIHDLRRSLASWMANTGANLSVIRSALNHKDIKTTLTVYAHANREAELTARRLAHETMLSLGKPSITHPENVIPFKRRGNE